MANLNPAEVQQMFSGLDYPASLEEVVDYAEQQGAGEDMVATLQRLPHQDFESPADLSDALSQTE